jgi:hypothetical protein
MGSNGELMRRIFAMMMFSLAILQAFVVLNTIAQPAYSYVDPGSGIFALQIISSTFAGILFMVRKQLRSYFEKITGGRFAQKNKSKGEND